MKFMKQALIEGAFHKFHMKRPLMEEPPVGTCAVVSAGIIIVGILTFMGRKNFMLN